jgi:hypothetical protein
VSDEPDNLGEVLGRTASSVVRPTVDPARLVEVELTSPAGKGHAYGRGRHDPELDLKQGPWRFFYEDGTVQSEVEYVGGLGQGPFRAWWEDGSERSRGDLHNDEFHGRWWFRNRDGSWYEADMVDGRTHGRTVYYGPNDMMFAIAEWNHGHRLWQIIRVPDEGWRRIEFREDGEPVDPDGVFLDRHPCPCCSYLTFPPKLPDDSDDEDAWCPVCGWLSDFVQNNQPKASGMPNQYSLIDSRKNFAEHGAAVPGDEQVRPPRDDEVPR